MNANKINDIHFKILEQNYNLNYKQHTIAFRKIFTNYDKNYEYERKLGVTHQLKPTCT